MGSWSKAEFKKHSCIQSFHIYKTPILSEQLECKNEKGNAKDQYAVELQYSLQASLH